MAPEVVVGQPQYLRIAWLWVWLSRIRLPKLRIWLSRVRVPQLRTTLHNLSAVLRPEILVNKQEEVRKCGGLEVGDVGGGT